jgi:hypothetical protein
MDRPHAALAKEAWLVASFPTTPRDFGLMESASEFQFVGVPSGTNTLPSGMRDFKT